MSDCTCDPFGDPEDGYDPKCPKHGIKPIPIAMTPTLTSLTNDQKRVLLAEGSGWKVDPELEDGALMGRIKREPDGWECWDMIPEYTTDLNAVHEFEKTLTEEQADSYQNTIAQGYSDVAAFESPAAYYWYHATARQRVDALLLALNLATK